ncbi:transcriptional regulator, ArsR family [Singulisphaera sp. GP187]|uniref:ArsR/SmtB family transcription factor n=1 Tax=Singulisphaera sp. GP187 TaxID=1882752 RepID=UPI0009265446|nr:helix-turn-helix domain-containing protein [Singulisphaera sp. GP187]SIN74841.1 transcriptional regulator, ArsR family [Singulisphaera sp. GP187]
MPEDLDRVWKALGDETRRSILDFLRDGPRTTTEIVAQFPQLSRFGVMKHIDVLREASLILTREQGRQRINTLNAVPIQQIYERWVSRYEGFWASTLLRIRDDAEPASAPEDPPRSTDPEDP